MSSQNFHKERFAEILHREIGNTIAKDLRDPRIPSLVTVTEVKLAPDYRNATVFVSIYGENEVKKEAISALNNAAPFIQRIVSGRVSVKHFPRLYFKIDNSLEHSLHINELLKEIKDDLE